MRPYKGIVAMGCSVLRCACWIRVFWTQWCGRCGGCDSRNTGTACCRSGGCDATVGSAETVDASARAIASLAQSRSTVCACRAVGTCSAPTCCLAVRTPPPFIATTRVRIRTVVARTIARAVLALALVSVGLTDGARVPW